MVLSLKIKNRRASVKSMIGTLRAECIRGRARVYLHKRCTAILDITRGCTLFRRYTRAMGLCITALDLRPGKPRFSRLLLFCRALHCLVILLYFKLAMFFSWCVLAINFLERKCTTNLFFTC